jgi:hypothetical protein
MPRILRGSLLSWLIRLEPDSGAGVPSTRVNNLCNTNQMLSLGFEVIVTTYEKIAREASEEIEASISLTILSASE